MKIKTLLFGLFIIGGWTLILGFVCSVFASVPIWMEVLPYWPKLVYFVPAFGFIIGVMHFRAILRSS